MGCREPALPVKAALNDSGRMFCAPHGLRGWPVETAMPLACQDRRADTRASRIWHSRSG